MHATNAPVLFHGDNASFFDIEALRAAARKEVEKASLIAHAAAGNAAAAKAMHVGY